MAVKAERAGRQSKVSAGLANWIELNRVIGKWTAKEVDEAIQIEKKRRGGPRKSILRRLKQRRSGIAMTEARRRVQ